MNLIAVCLPLLLAISCCQKHSPTGEAAVSSEGFLSAAERIELHLPAIGKLTLGTDADRGNANALDPEVSKAIEAFLKPRAVEWQICVARPIGKHILLWIGFPKIADGGADLIYSVEKKKIVGEFCGGYKG